MNEKIIISPVLFSKEQIEIVEKIRNAKYVCAFEHKGVLMEVFYGDDAHPVSGSRYFALYKTHNPHSQLMITNGAWIEDVEIDAVTADNGDIIYSRYRHDMRKSPDNSVWIDGGPCYTRSGVYSNDRWKTLIVRDGVLQIKNE